MDITSIKFWSKVVMSENVEHVKISWYDFEAGNSKHWSGPDARGEAAFYNAFNNLNFYMTKLLSVSEELATAFSVRSVSIKSDQDKDGNDRTHYTFIAGFKSGYAATEIKTSISAKAFPEGLALAMETLCKEAERYIDGAREPHTEQQDAFKQAEEGAADDMPDDPGIEDDSELEIEIEPEEGAAL